MSLIIKKNTQLISYEYLTKKEKYTHMMDAYLYHVTSYFIVQNTQSCKRRLLKLLNLVYLYCLVCLQLQIPI